MFNIYKKQRIREIPVEIDADYNNIPYSSVLFLTKYSDFEESFFDKFGNEHWKTVTSELFTTCIVNLLITRKIKAVYYTDRKSILFNLIKIDSEGFNIFSTENLVNNQHDDILANNLLDVLSTIPIHSLENYLLAINLVVNKYIGTSKSARPEKKFFHEYLKVYSIKHHWIKLKEESKLFGLFSDFNVTLEEDKKLELHEFQKKYNSIKFHLRKNNVLFRNFLTYTENVVSVDFFTRYPDN